MAKFDLTNTERLILANQYKILSHLENDDSYARLSDELLEGHEWLYADALGNVAEVMPTEDAEHVITILGIFGDLRDSYDQLADKSGIDPHDVTFLGFDGNNESDLRSFARGLRKADRFADTLGDEVKNSHMPTTDLYRRMIAKWRELGEPNYPYSKDTMLAIIAARVHPDNRE